MYNRRIAVGGLLQFRQLLIVATVVLYFVALFWLCGKANPLGGMPYRYGTWLGIVYGFIAATGLIVAIKRLTGADFETPRAIPKAIGEALAAIVFISFLASISIGLLRRKRYGVVLFFVLQVLLFVYSSLAASFGGQTIPIQLATALVVGVIFLIVPGMYFGKRWKFMSTTIGESGSQPLPAAKDTGMPRNLLDQ